jgi:hypothetical protein
MPTISIILMLVALIMTTAQAEPLPYPKPRDGQCAGSYVQSGGFCVPKSGGTVREAIPKPQGAQWAQQVGHHRARGCGRAATARHETWKSNSTKSDWMSNNGL